MTIYLSVPQVLNLHEDLVGAFGGALATRERGSLEAAVARPTATFGGEELYPDVAAKAAALMHSLVLNHPFIDGNKRTAYVALEFFLALNGVKFPVGDAEAVVMMVAMASGEATDAEFIAWVRRHAMAP